MGLMLLAAVFFLLEFMVPSAGLLGIGAAMAAVAALFLAYTESISTGFAMTGIAALGVPVIFLTAIRVWPHTPIGRRILNLPPIDESAAGDSGNVRDNPYRDLIGKVGRARTNLLPSGLIEIDGRRYDAVAMGTVIDRDDAIEVINVEAGKIRVRKTERRPASIAESGIVADDATLAGRSLEDLNLEDLGDPLT